MSKGRLGTTGTSYLGVGGKRANQPNPELVKLKNEIEELQLEKEESRKNLLHFISELDEANRKNKELEKQMTELKASDKDSQQQDSSTAGKNGSLEDSVDNHDANQSNLRQIEEQLSVALKENQDLKQESEKQVKAREESKRRLEEQIESMKEVNASLKSKIDSLESQIQSGTGYQTANVEQHSEEQNQKFEEDLKSMQEKATMLEEQLNETKSRLDQANTNAEQNAAERDHVKDSLMNLKLQIETVNKDREAKDRKINSLEATLEQHKTSENDKKRLEELSETVATLEAEIKQIQSADQEKSHKINELEEALQENNAVTKEKEQLLVKIQSAEAALEQAKKADEEKASKINALETSLQESKSADQAREQLVEKIAAVEMALEEIKHADEAKAGEIKSLKASLEKSESIAQEKDLLTEKIASLEANLKKSLGAEADRQQLVEKVTSLESALKQAEESALDKNKLTDRITSLETALEKSEESEKEKDELNERIATLQTSLEKMRSSEKDDKRKGNTKESELSKKLTNLQKKLDNTNQERQNAEKNSAKKITKLQEQKKAAEEQANEKHKEIVNLNRQIEEMRSSDQHDVNNNAQLLSDKQNVENEYEDLKAKHETLISQLTEAKSRLEVFDQRGQEAEKLQSDLSELHKVIDELKISRQADKDAAEVKKRDILADVEKHLERIAELEEVELDLRNKLQNNEATSESTEALFAEARKQRDELSAWKTEHEALQLQQKDNHDATYQELSAKIEELNDLVTKHKDSEQSASQLISSLEGKVLSAESIAKEQETQYRKISESLEIAKETLNQKDAHIVELENNLKSVDERLELATQRAHKLEKEKSNLAEETVAYKSQLSELTSQLVTIQQDAQAAVKQHAEKLNAQKEEHNNNLKALESKLAKAVSIESDLHQTITDLRAELKSGQDQSEASKLAIDELKKQLDEASSALIAAESDAKGLRDEVEAAKGASSLTISDLEIAKEDALHKVQEIERRLEETKKNADRLETEKASLSHTLQGSLDEARKEIDTLKSEAANSSKQAEEHLELIHHLQQELESAKSKSDKAAADMEQIVRDNQSAKERMESAKIELKNMKGENEKLLNEAKYHHKTIEDVKGREGHLRLLNKTLQDEIRKLSRPNSAASTQISPASRSETHIASDSSSPSDRMSFSIPRKLSSGGTPPEVNTEYLKNIMIKFIEDKRTRSQLIPVLATMLNFTPEETHRLQSKV